MESMEINKQIQEFLNKGIIHPSTSPCGLPIVLVPKKDETWHMCVDFDALKRITVKNRYPLPRIDDFINQIMYAKHFTKLNLRRGYHQVRLVEEDIWKTTFKLNKNCLSGLLCLLVLQTL